MWIGRALIRSPKGRVFLAALACYGAWQGWLQLVAPGKIDARVPRTGRDPVDVVVTLPFPPERFHVLAFQQFGRVSGTADHEIELRGVRPSDLRGVARPYWVRRVAPLAK